MNADERIAFITGKLSDNWNGTKWLDLHNSLREDVLKQVGNVKRAIVDDHITLAAHDEQERRLAEMVDSTDGPVVNEILTVFAAFVEVAAG